MSLIGHRILRDFSSDYSLPSPLYFVGVITEYKEPTFPHIRRNFLPDKNHNDPLGDGLYRVRYLDATKDDVSPVEAYEGCCLYNSCTDKICSADRNTYFNKKMYPNPNDYSVKELMEEEEMFYKRYERHFRLNNISLKLLEIENESQIHHEQVLKTEYGNVAVSSLIEQNILSDIIIKHLPDEEDGYYYSLSGDSYLGSKTKYMDFALSLSFSCTTSRYD